MLQQALCDAAAPRPHTVKLRQHGLCSRPCWSPCAWNHRSVKTARKGALHEKRSSPARASFFVVLTGWCFRATSRSDTLFPSSPPRGLHRRAVTHRPPPASGCSRFSVLHLNIDIFCHLSIFFLTSARRCVNKQRTPRHSRGVLLLSFLSQPVGLRPPVYAGHQPHTGKQHHQR